MPHVPLFASEKFKGKSGAGLYGDVMMEIDWSVGEIMKALHDAGLDDNTLVFFSSDNGPWAVYGNHAGKTPYREAKATGFDGGTRSACIMRYPGQDQSRHDFERKRCAPSICCPPWRTWPGRNCRRIRSTAATCGTSLPISPAQRIRTTIIRSRPARSSKASSAATGTGSCTCRTLTTTWRSAGKDGMPGKYGTRSIEMALFDMEKDPYETTNVLEQYPDIARRLKGYAEEHRREFYPDQPDSTNRFPNAHPIVLFSAGEPGHADVLLLETSRGRDRGAAPAADRAHPRIRLSAVSRHVQRHGYGQRRQNLLRALLGTARHGRAYVRFRSGHAEGGDCPATDTEASGEKGINGISQGKSHVRLWKPRASCGSRRNMTAREFEDYSLGAP